VDITKAAFERQGYVPQFQFFPWARALASTESGLITVLLAAYYTPERAATYLYSDLIGTTRVFLVKRADQKITYKTFADAEQNMRKLLAGRIDLFVEKEERVNQLLATTFKDDASKLEFLYLPLQVNQF
jgi:polar amino acid transport system substrate-binding protein